MRLAVWHETSTGIRSARAMAEEDVKNPLQINRLYVSDV
jgi:hypothetical protein